jgi:hypothetical protein
MAIKPPKKKLTPQQRYNQGLMPTRTSTGATYAKVPTVKATGPKVQANFQPTKLPKSRFGAQIASGKNRQPWQAPGVYGPTPPGQMPYEFSDRNTAGDSVQDQINAGRIKWTPGLGNLGYQQPPRAPTNINIPGFGGGDLMSGVLGDWEYGAAVGDIEAANRADEVAAGENINALAVGWGGDLSDMVKQGLIDQKAAEAAKANQFSTMAQLQRSLEQGGGQLANQLAARGGLDSGALAGGQQQLQRNYQQETQSGLQELMSSIRSIRSQQAQARAGRQSDLAGVRANVAARLSQLEQYQPIPNMQAFWDPQVQSYVDDWGRRFDRNGQRLS